MKKKKSSKSKITKTVKKKTVAKKSTRKVAPKAKNISKIVAPAMDEDHSVLKEALKDIARELGQLREEKEDLEGTLDSIAMDITTTQNEEVQLKDQVRKLNSVESALALKRSRLRTKLEGIKTKIQKVRQLSAKMESL